MTVQNVPENVWSESFDRVVDDKDRAGLPRPIDKISPRQRAYAEHILRERERLQREGQ